ncbi:conserved hypothetical protein [Rhizobium sp. EC-SD404]|nr:conserved hypothetical protein [Rhizobium sp. EC-SD404]
MRPQASTSKCAPDAEFGARASLERDFFLIRTACSVFLDWRAHWEARTLQNRATCAMACARMVKLMMVRSEIARALVLASLALGQASFPESLAQAQEKPEGVVELFTSQGCSSCPPADAVLADLAAEGNVIALAYHVDYWNYLGWKDTLASPENTARQKAYATTFERKSVYTPQAVLNGRDHVNGASRGHIDTTLSAMERDGRGLVVDVDVAHDDDTLVIDVGEGEGKAHVMLVVFDRENIVPIEAGENDGASYTYVNSVREVQIVGVWKGDAERITLPDMMIDDWDNRNGAILLQRMVDDRAPGAIIGAALIKS